MSSTSIYNQEMLSSLKAINKIIRGATRRHERVRPLKIILLIVGSFILIVGFMLMKFDYSLFDSIDYGYMIPAFIMIYGLLFILAHLIIQLVFYAKIKKLKTNKVFFNEDDEYCLNMFYICYYRNFYLKKNRGVEPSEDLIEQEMIRTSNIVGFTYDKYYDQPKSSNASIGANNSNNSVSNTAPNNNVATKTNVVSKNKMFEEVISLKIKLNNNAITTEEFDKGMYEALQIANIEELKESSKKLDNLK